MTTFLVVAAIMLLVSLLLIIPVFWRPSTVIEHDQQQFNVDIAREALQQLESQRDAGALSTDEFSVRRVELENNLALSLENANASSTPGNHNGHSTPSIAAKIMGGILCVMIPAASLWTYFETGTPEAMDETFLAQVNAVNEPAQNQPTADLPPIDELLPRLEAHLADNPDDLQGWRLLGVTNLRLQRYSDAEAALESAYKLDEQNIDVMMLLIDARTMARQGQMDDRTETLLNQVLQLSPQDPRGLWVLGMLKQQRGDVAGAITSWETLLSQLGDQPEAQAEVRLLIEEASNGSLAPAPSNNDQSGTASLTVEVSLKEEVAVVVPATAAVFIYAKATSGPPMPLAVARHQVSELPLRVTLTDEMAMMPQMKLSQFDSVTIGARVSLSGDPVASTGDFFTEVDNIVVDDNDVINLLINERVP